MLAGTPRIVGGSGGGGGGSGTVTSIAASTGITLTPNPIITIGTVGLTIPVVISSGGTNSTTALSGSTIMISNGTGIVQGTAGTTTTVLHGNAAGVPTYGAIVLTTDVSGILPVANGGTGSATAPYVNDATNSTLTRSGTGPYTLGINLGNANTWTAAQTFATSNPIITAAGLNFTHGGAVTIGTTDNQNISFVSGGVQAALVIYNGGSPEFQVNTLTPIGSTLTIIEQGSNNQINFNSAGTRFGVNGNAAKIFTNGHITFGGVTDFAGLFGLNVAPTATASYGTISLGGGAWTSTGAFVGSSSGTSLAINEVSGYAGDLIRAQVAGATASSFRVDSSGNVYAGGITSGAHGTFYGTGMTQADATGMDFNSTSYIAFHSQGGTYANPQIQFTQQNTATRTSGDQTFMWLSTTFAPTSGTATWESIYLQPVINQTGGANGITRGIYINPTLTAAADFRALEITAGKIFITAGSNTAVGTGTLTGGSVTVSNTSVTANSLIFLTDTTAGALTNVGSLVVSAKVASTSFTVTSTNVLDTSTFNYLIIN